MVRRSARNKSNKSSDGNKVVPDPEPSINFLKAEADNSERVETVMQMEVVGVKVKEEKEKVVEEQNNNNNDSVIENNMDFNSEVVVTQENSNFNSHIPSKEAHVEAQETAAAVGAVEEENSAANTKNMKSPGHTDDTFSIREDGDGDGEGDSEKSREDVEDGEDSVIKNGDSVIENNMNFNSEVVVVVVEDNAILNSEGVVEEGNLNLNVNVNGEGVVEEKSLGTALEDNINLDSEVVNIEENSYLNSHIASKEAQVEAEETAGENDASKVHCDQAAVGEVEEENSAANTKDMKSPEHTDGTFSIREDGDGEGDCEKSREDVEDDEDSEYSEEDSEEDNEEDEDPSEFSNDPLSNQKKQKQLEIYVGGLDKGAVEEDLIEVFRKFGEVQAARIVKHPTTNKSKGFGFIHYATVDQAKKALSELKDGIEVRGKRVKISASHDNGTLYMGNICRTWTKEQVLEKLKGYGVEHIEEIHLPNDPASEGKTKGFALLEFNNHTDAMAAFQRLRKPDVDFGCGKSAKVAFAQTPMHPSAEVLSQVKTVYIKGLTKSWDVEKLKVLCKQYGEIKRVKLSQTFGAKSKDSGFIVFTSRESALACVEGINNAQIGEGEGKVKANIAKPYAGGKLPKVTHGGFKVKKESERATGSKMKGHAKPKEDAIVSERKRKAGCDESRVNEKKGKAVAEEKSQALSKSRSLKEGKPKRPQTIVTKGQDDGVPSKVEKTDHKRKNSPSKVDGRGKRAMDHDRSKRPSKKPRGMQGRRGHASQSKHHFREGPVHGADSVAYRIPYASGYAPSTSSYQGRATSGISGSKRHHADMEPHAGYLEPAIRKPDRHYAGYLEPALKRQAQAHPGYLEPTPGNHGQPHVRYLEPYQSQSQPHARYLEPAPRNHGQPHVRYLEPSHSQSQPHARYLEPATGREGLPHAGYLEPAVVRQDYNVYNYRLRSGAGGYNSQGSQGSAYGKGSALPPYVRNYTSYARYEDNGNVGGYHHSGEAYLPRQTQY